jgi:hypothetical protein
MGRVSCLLLLSTIASLAAGHSWVEQLTVVANNGSFVGEPGFARGNVLRTSPGFSDPTMVNLIPPNGRSTGLTVLSTDSMCRPSQQTQNQTEGSPRLQALAGQRVALRYQENGHVSLPQNQPGKPSNRGTVFVYATNDSQPTDTLLAIHRVWNEAGTGGDGRGVLLAQQDFDDGRCYQINSGTISVSRQATFPHVPDTLQGANLWCQNDIVLPASAQVGSPLTLYWVWDWPTAPGTPGFVNGKPELYTTCMDIDITGVATSVTPSRIQAGSPDFDNVDGAVPTHVNFDSSVDVEVLSGFFSFVSGAPSSGVNLASSAIDAGVSIAAVAATTAPPSGNPTVTAVVGTTKTVVITKTVYEDCSLPTPGVDEDCTEFVPEATAPAQVKRDLPDPEVLRALRRSRRVANWGR